MGDERSSDPAARTPVEAAARWCGAASVVDEIEAGAIRAIPLRRLATAQDIAESNVFLTGARSGFITGQILTVDGGMTLA